MRYPCLVLDHDDTVVRSEQTVNFPQFLETLAELRPGMRMSRAEFTRGCLTQGFSGLCRDQLHFTPEEAAHSFESWKQYVRTHIPPAYEGIRELLLRHKQRGGLICVVSHSSCENIARDYAVHFGLKPDLIYGWELGESLRKPNPYPLLDIMEKTGLPSAQLLMVDDLKPGLDMATACGVPFACAGWSHYLPEIAEFMRTRSPVYFQTVQEFSDYLEQGT